MSWSSDLDLEVGESRFHCAFPYSGPRSGSIPVMKTRPMVEAYVDLVQEMAPRRIVELGIRRGGSTAFLHALAEPERLVALELATKPASYLVDHVERHRAGAVVRPCYGVDQGDRVAVADICDREFGDAPLDLVVDDASHLYGPTLASFEVLFPRLRPGGRFVIEDWTAHYLMLTRWADGFDRLDRAEQTAFEDHLREVGLPRPEPLVSLLTLELVLARASDRDVVADIHVDRYWTVVTRGTEPLDPVGFRLRDHYHDHMHLFDGVLPAR